MSAWSRSIHDYIVQIANATRTHPDLRLGVSTRGTLTMLRVARAFAATDERDYVTPDDVKTVAAPVFAHRMALTAEAELRGADIETVLADIIDEVPVPRTARADVLTSPASARSLAAVVLAGLGWWWNYEELVVAAFAIGAVLLVAIWVSQRPLRAEVTPAPRAVRVPRGDPIVVELSRAQLHPVPVWPCHDHRPLRRRRGPRRRSRRSRSNTEHAVTGSIPTRRRGVFDVGPFEIERIDPFWLTVGRRRDTARAR